MKSKFFILFALLSITCIDAQNLDINSGLVAYYPFNGNAKDITKKHNGKIVGAKSTTDRMGRKDSALKFDGLKSHVIIPHSESFNFGANQDFSISFWVKIPESQVNTKTINNDIISKWKTKDCKSPNSYPFVIRYNNKTYDDSELKFKIAANRYSQSSKECSRGGKSNQTVNDNKWHFIVFQQHKDSLYFYVDNALNSVKVKNGNCNYKNSAPLIIGKRRTTNCGNPNSFKGSIDELRIYNRALNHCELEALSGISSSKNCNSDEITKDAIKVTSKTVTVKIWDDAKEDGDIVSVYLNDARIKKEITVKKNEHIFTIELNQGVNTFKLFAHNEGSISPNTAAILIDDGTQEHTRTLSSKKDEFAELKIVLE